MGPLGSPETSVLNHFTQRDNPEDGRIRNNENRFSQRKKMSLLYGGMLRNTSLVEPATERNRNHTRVTRELEGQGAALAVFN